jgi:hypothetical protein
LGEIQAGIEITREQDPGRAADQERWAEAEQRSRTCPTSSTAVHRSAKVARRSGRRTYRSTARHAVGQAFAFLPDGLYGPLEIPLAQFNQWLLEKYRQAMTD